MIGAIPDPQPGGIGDDAGRTDGTGDRQRRTIAFVALAGPQIARRLTRAPGVPLISGALTGAALLLGTDLISQRALVHLMLPIGSITDLYGGLYLVWLLGGAQHDFPNVTLLPEAGAAVIAVQTQTDKSLHPRQDC